MIYLDNAATTPVSEEVKLAMQPYFQQKFANPSSLYDMAVNNRMEINKARKTIASALNANEKEIFFTSGGTEADNWALRMAVAGKKEGLAHIITSKIEHHAILNTCNQLEKEGVRVTYLDVDEAGVANLEQLKKSISKDTVIISIMFANNEIGTIEPIKEIGKIARDNNIIFHTDAVQAFGHCPIDVKELNIDMLSASGHKFNGPKGTGFLYVKDTIAVKPLIYGGQQEMGMRAGTENVPGIVGIGKACELAMKDIQERSAKIKKVKDYLVTQVLSKIPYVRLNGHYYNRLSNNANFSFQFVDGETMVIMLNMEGICASGGSACSSGQSKPSHVLMALGLPQELAYGTLRLTLGEDTTIEEIDKVVYTIDVIVKDLRDKSDEYLALFG